MKKKILSLIIAIILSISSLVISNNAVFGVNEDNTTSLIESQMPNVVSLDGDIELKHIRRISSSEKSLNEICFENVDGSITSYTFNYPVKYLDKQGNVVDKSNEITETEDGFESLNNDIKTTFGNALTDGISISAYISIRDLMCESESMTVFCHTFTGTSWNEASASWSNTSPNSYVSSALSSKNISYSNGASLNPAHRYSFNITNAVKGWKNGTYSQSKGIIFKASSSVENASTNIKKTFASYNRSAYQPILVVNYTTSNTISASNLKIYQTENTYINDAFSTPAKSRFNSLLSPLRVIFFCIPILRYISSKSQIISPTMR